jgi:hypothetical protein
MLTKKATKALHDIAEGNRAEVTRQMIDRLSAQWLIDFDPNRGGWFLTHHGWNSISQQH